VTECRVDRDWLESNFPCYQACPWGPKRDATCAHAEGDSGRPMPGPAPQSPRVHLRRICAAPCEPACRRGALDQPIAIRALKRSSRALRRGEHDRSGRSPEIYGDRRARYPLDRVAVVGAGPRDWRRPMTWRCAATPSPSSRPSPVPGGMLRLGIPEYRLPRELIKLDQCHPEPGVDLRVGARIGRDFRLADLKRQGFRAVFLASGPTRAGSWRFRGRISTVCCASRLPPEHQHGIPAGFREEGPGGGWRERGGGRGPHRSARRRAGRGDQPGDQHRHGPGRCPSAIRFGARKSTSSAWNRFRRCPLTRRRSTRPARGIVIHAGRGPCGSSG